MWTKSSNNIMASNTKVTLSKADSNHQQNSQSTPNEISNPAIIKAEKENLIQSQYLKQLMKMQ